MYVCTYRTLDPSLAEAVSSLLWIAPRLGNEVGEFKAISDQLTIKFGKKYADVSILNVLITCCKCCLLGVFVNKTSNLIFVSSIDILLISVLTGFNFSIIFSLLAGFLFVILSCINL